MAAPSSPIPSVQRAAVLLGPYGDPHTVQSTFPVGQPGPGEVLVRLQASGICSGDVNPRDGFPPAPAEPRRPLVTGHEGVGVVVAVGAGVASFAVGDRAGLGWRGEVCRACDECGRGADNLCQRQKMNGYDRHGTFEEYVVASESALFAIPAHASVPATRLAPLLCAGGTALAGVRATQAPAGSWLCVTGAAGGVGALACRYALQLGYRVVAVDSARKAAVCEALGVQGFVDYETADTVAARVRAQTGGAGAHGVVVCSANPTSYSQALDYAAVGARIVSIGPSAVSLHTGHLMVKGLSLVGQSNGSRQDIEDAVRLGVENGILPQVVVVDLDHIDEALDNLKAGKTQERQVLDWEA